MKKFLSIFFLTVISTGCGTESISKNKVYGEWGSYEDFVATCERREYIALNSQTFDGSKGSLIKYIENIAEGWYSLREDEGFKSNKDQNNAMNYKNDWIDYVRKNCP